jgi:predicted nucleic acid-binding protein
VTLIDSNVLIDLLVDDPKWSDWSLAHLEQAALKGPSLINDIVYAETSTRYSAIEDFESALEMPTFRSCRHLELRCFSQAKPSLSIAVLVEFAPAWRTFLSALMRQSNNYCC